MRDVKNIVKKILLAVPLGQEEETELGNWEKFIYTPIGHSIVRLVAGFLYVGSIIIRNREFGSPGRGLVVFDTLFLGYLLIPSLWFFLLLFHSKLKRKSGNR